MRVINKRVGERFTYYPLSDVHWPEHEEKYLKSWLDMVKADDSALVTLGGDLFDFARTAARNHLKSYRKDKNSYLVIDRVCNEEVERFAKFLDPIKDKIVGTVAGNHHHEFLDGQIGDQKLCLLLDSAWLGASGFIRVRMKGGAFVTILIHHDAGSSARTPGADFNTFHKAAQAVDADIIALGHTHRLYTVPGATRITVGNGTELDATQTIFIRSGAYLKRYHEAESGSDSDPYVPEYGEEKLYQPSTLGHCYVEVAANRKKLRYKLVTEVF